MARTARFSSRLNIARTWKGSSRDRACGEHVQRAQIILLSAVRLPVLEIAKRVGVSRPMVWRWQQRFAEEGMEDLLRDKTRPPGIPPAPQAKVHAVVERTLREPPGGATDRTGRAMAKAMGFRCERSSAYGPPISSSRTGSGPSSDPPIPTSPPSLMMSSVST